MRLIAGVPPVDTQSSRKFSNLLDCFTVTRDDGVRFGRDNTDCVNVSTSAATGDQYVAGSRGWPSGQDRRSVLRFVGAAGNAKAVRAHTRSSSLDFFHVARSETIAQGTSQLTQAKDACAREMAMSRRV
jgi:hypothetical protein